jgi:pimeloyl-ACP methyl ester carboxylesterase
MVESGYRLITEGLEVAHLRLIIGSSMGGMHAWMWAEMYPDLMDGVDRPARESGGGDPRARDDDDLRQWHDHPRRRRQPAVKPDRLLETWLWPDELAVSSKQKDVHRVGAPMFLSE